MITPEAVASGYAPWPILARRWAATWIDFILVGAFFIASDLLVDTLLNLGSLGIALRTAVAVAYYPVLERSYGATPGKLMLRLRIVDASGANPSTVQVVIRTLLRFVEVIPFSWEAYPPESLSWRRRSASA